MIKTDEYFFFLVSNSQYFSHSFVFRKDMSVKVQMKETKRKRSKVYFYMNNMIHILRITSLIYESALV